MILAGVDIGATKLHVVVADGDGRVLGRVRNRLGKAPSFDSVMARVRDTVHQCCAAVPIEPSALDAIGVGAPSPVLPNGTAVRAPNLGWADVPLTATIAELLGRPCHALNDCDAGTFGEHVYGAARGARTAVGLFVGTGLGGGIVHEGKILNGDNHQAAEIGHMVVVRDGRRCGCGRRGCLEAYASKRGIARRLRRIIEQEGRKSWLADQIGGSYAKLKSSQLAEAYAREDKVAVEVLHEAAEVLGVGVGNLVTLLGPSVVVLGGGVLEALGEALIDRVRVAAREVAWPPSSIDDTRIELAALGDDAVALGAVAFALGKMGVVPKSHRIGDWAAEEARP